MLAIALTSLLQSAPKLDAIEARVQELLKPIGGELSWVTPESPSFGDEWVLCLDIDNKGRSFDCSSLAPLKRLYALRILGGRVSEQGLSTLASLPKLGLLVVTGEGVTDRGLLKISKCKSIYKLDVAGNHVSKNGLNSISNMKSLRRVFFYGTKIQDSDISALSKMTFLNELVLPETVSIAARNKLAEALPTTDIRRM